MLALFLLYRELFSDCELSTDRELREACTNIVLNTCDSLTHLWGVQKSITMRDPTIQTLCQYLPMAILFYSISFMWIKSLPLSIYTLPSTGWYDTYHSDISWDIDQSLMISSSSWYLFFPAHIFWNWLVSSPHFSTQEECRAGKSYMTSD